MIRQVLITGLAVGLLASLDACSTREIATGAAVGAGAYEYSNKRAMDDLKGDYKSGMITRSEYEKRKEDIESRSLLY